MLSHLVISLGFLVTATNGTFVCLHHRCQHQCVKLLFFAYECRCYSGYSVAPYDRHKCVPIKPTCPHGYQNSAYPPYDCAAIKPTCPHGYQNSAYPPYDCADFDECSSGSSPCEQNCRNSQGSYYCFCNSGYAISARDHTKCEQPAVATCQNGFQPNPSNLQICIDINECAVGLPCQQLCMNSDGSYECRCRAGYQINERDRSKCDLLS